MPSIICFRTFWFLEYKRLMNPYPFTAKRNRFSSYTTTTYNGLQSWDHYQKLGIEVTSHGPPPATMLIPVSILGSSLIGLWDRHALSPLNLGLGKTASTLLSKDDFSWEYWLFYLEDVKKIIVDCNELLALKSWPFTTLQISVDFDIGKLSSSSLNESSVAWLGLQSECFVPSLDLSGLEDRSTSLVPIFKVFFG